MRRFVITALRRPATSIRLQALSHPPSRATREVAGAVSGRRRIPTPTQIRARRLRATPADSRMNIHTTSLVPMGVHERTLGAEFHSEKASLSNFQCGKNSFFVHSQSFKSSACSFVSLHSLIFVIFVRSIFCFRFLSFL